MLKGTLNSSLRLIRTKNLYSDGDELSVVYCTHRYIFCEHTRLLPVSFCIYTQLEIARSTIILKVTQLSYLKVTQSVV